MIKRRLVYQIAGYDPVDAARQHRRFARGLATFAKTWNVRPSISDFVEPSPGVSGRWTVTTDGGNWRVEATYAPMVWNDIVQADLEKPMPARLARYGLALFDLFRTGTVFRYFRASWKYGGFCLYPAVYLLAFAGIGVGIGYGLAELAGLQGAARGLAMAVSGIASFCVLLPWLGRRWRITQALDDWIFAYDYLHGRRPDVEARLDRFARELVAAARENRYDEILVVGHSLGATLAVNVAARALGFDPELGLRGTPVCVMTVGSTIPKFTLHPRAIRIRLDVARLAAAPAVDWAEYHARADPISFYMFDPAGGRIKRDRFDRKPIIRLVRIKNMVRAGGYRRIQFKFMRVHHQFVMANERRTAYDFYMMGCGPIPFARCVAETDGPAALIGADGEWLDAVADHPPRIAASA